MRAKKNSNTVNGGLRGGCFDEDDSWYLSVDLRAMDEPVIRSKSSGFRLVIRRKA